MKVIYLAATSALGPASRYRIYQFRKYFEQDGVDLEILPALSDDWLKAERETGFKRRLARLRAGGSGLARRIHQIRNLGDCDLLIVERELFPKLPGIIENHLLGSLRPYGVEFDDAIYLSDGRAEKYPELVQGSSFVIAGNAVLAGWAEAYQPNTHVVPTCVTVSNYNPKTDYALSGCASLGWVGLPVNFGSLEAISPVVDNLPGANAKLSVVSGRCPNFLNPEAFTPWSEATEAECIGQFDVGLMPLPATPFAEGKCGLKILQYMAAGIPVVASAIGVNRTIIEHGVNGLLIERNEDWGPTLSRVINDESLRAKLGRAGRKTVEAKYSTEVWGPKLVALYRQLASAL